MNVNVKRESFVKVLGHSVRVPNWAIVERKPWSAAKIARVEVQAQRLGELETFVTSSPLFPVACVLVFLAVWIFGVGGVPLLVDTLLG